MDKYQDYVIKDGVFIGQFEDMYKKFDDPWLQASSEHIDFLMSRSFHVLMIRKYGIRSVLDCGCGLGYYTNFLHDQTQVNVKGIDISPTAIQKAKSRWPHLDFSVDGVQNIESYARFEAVLFAEITWYILNDLDSIFKKMLQYFPGKFFLQNLTFYKGQQKYGREFFTTLEEFINYCPFKLLGYSLASTVETEGIDTGTIFKIEPK
jgi:SAM-dependent methyltransferase